MIPLLKIIVLAICALIAFQDFKDRMVSWVLFPLMGLVLGGLYLTQVSFEQYYPFVTLNFVLVSLVLFTLFLYTKHVAKMKFLNVSFGLGDLLFFYALALGFPTMTFVTLFALSIVFSLGTFIFLSKKMEKQTVPLAGLMGVFLCVVLLTSFFPNVPSLYIF